jgi:hypothetical protein
MHFEAGLRVVRKGQLAFLFLLILAAIGILDQQKVRVYLRLTITDNTNILI